MEHHQTVDSWGDSISKQIDFLKRCIALNLQSGGLLDLLDRIEELERERDAFYMDYRMKCDEQTKSLCVERDALQADNERLREALEGAFKAGAENGGSK